MAPALLGGALGGASVASLLPLDVASSWQLWACHALASLAACARRASPPPAAAAVEGSKATLAEQGGQPAAAPPPPAAAKGVRAAAMRAAPLLAPLACTGAAAALGDGYGVGLAAVRSAVPH